MQFTHTISKGSRYNQVYIPKGMEIFFEVGDTVEVKLIKKRIQLQYSKNLKRLSDFKETVIKSIFSAMYQYPSVLQTFIVGSFLKQKAEYHDVDVLIVVQKKDDTLEKTIYGELGDLINLKFHLMMIPQERFLHLLESCPLVRNMLSCFVSDQPFKPLPQRVIDQDHIKFLLMMPEDLLTIRVPSRGYYDSMRRLIVIKNFLVNEENRFFDIEEELASLMQRALVKMLSDNEPIDNKSLKKVRAVIKSLLDSISKVLKNG